MSPCTDVTVENALTLKPENTVQEAMVIFKENNIRSIPVVDDQEVFFGVFGLRHVLKKLLPASVQMEDGLENLDFVREATPGITKRLQKLYAEQIGENIENDIASVEPDTSMWEMTRVMATQGSPVAIVEAETKKFVGLVTRQTLLDHLDSEVQEAIES